MGWSDETEMLAKLYSLLHKHWYNSDLNWEKCLPAKYVGAADYSLIDDTVDQQALGRQLMTGLQSYIDAANENKKFQQ
jgi:hypothetical protein